jgi:hypothetical protein
LYKFSKPWYIQKSNFYFERNFPSTFGPAASRPIWPFGPLTPAGLFLPPLAPKQSKQACTTGQHRVAPMVGPDNLHQREKITASPLLHPPIK